MSLQPEAIGPVPAEAVRVAHAAFPKGNQHLLLSIEKESDGGWLAQIPAVSTLRQVWEQQYRVTMDQIRWRNKDDLPLPHNALLRRTIPKHVTAPSGA